MNPELAGRQAGRVQERGERNHVVLKFWHLPSMAQEQAMSIGFEEVAKLLQTAEVEPTVVDAGMITVMDLAAQSAVRNTMPMPGGAATPIEWEDITQQAQTWLTNQTQQSA